MIGRLLCFLGRHQWWKVSRTGLNDNRWQLENIPTHVCGRCPAKRFGWRLTELRKGDNRIQRPGRPAAEATPMSERPETAKERHARIEAAAAAARPGDWLRFQAEDCCISIEGDAYVSSKDDHEISFELSAEDGRVNFSISIDKFFELKDARL